LQFVDKELDLDGRLEVYDHLDRCDICRDAVYEVSRDRDEAFFIYRMYRAEPSILQRSMITPA
jgi:anti-sigma factor RsiW